MSSAAQLTVNIPYTRHNDSSRVNANKMYVYSQLKVMEDKLNRHVSTGDIDVSNRGPIIPKTG